MPANNFQSACLLAHNTIREDFACPKLVWSDDVASTAKTWANTLAMKGYLQHSENRVNGENILITQEGENVSGSQVVYKWLDEADVYQFEAPMWQYNTNHFTQMVWKNSTEFGVAKARMKNNNKYIVVAHYKPIGNGNMPGEYKKNVPGQNAENISIRISMEPESDPESESECEKEKHVVTSSKLNVVVTEIMTNVATLPEESTPYLDDLADEIRDDGRENNMIVNGDPNDSNDGEDMKHVIVEDVLQQEIKVVKATPIWDSSEYDEEREEETNNVRNNVNDEGGKEVELHFDVPVIDIISCNEGEDEQEEQDVIEEDVIHREVKIVKSTQFSWKASTENETHAYEDDKVDDQEFEFISSEDAYEVEATHVDVSRYPDRTESDVVYTEDVEYDEETGEDAQHTVVLNGEHSSDEDMEV